MSQPNHTALEAAILKTIAFFDLFDYPLTSFEIWQYLGSKASLSEVIAALENNNGSLKRSLGFKEGFYFAVGRDQLCRHRQETFQRSNLANHRARWVFNCLKHLPGVELLAVCNNFYYTPESDVDIFVITASQRLWLTRFLVTVITHLLGRRRHGRKIAGRLCLSFYISREALDLSPLALTDDPYFYYWLAFVEPLYENGAFQDFWQANDWLANKLPNFKKAGSLAWHKIQPALGWPISFSRRLYGGWIGDILEKTLRSWQKRKMSHNRTSLAERPDTRVVISDTVLKFHESDRRELFLKRLQERWQQLLDL